MFNTSSPLLRYTSASVPTINSEAHFALVFHTVQGDTVTTKHEVNSHNQLCAGTIVDPIDIIHATLEAKKAQHNNAHSPVQSQILSTRVVVDDHQKLLWHSKAQHREMWFSGRECGTATLRVWWPNLLFMLNKRGQRLSVFALATSARPHADTPIYQAPLMNINDAGLICLGSAQLPKDKTSANIVEMENCLYDSNFSHLNVKSTKQPHMADDRAHVTYYRERQKTKAKFAARDLIRVGKLNSLL